MIGLSPFRLMRKRAQPTTIEIELRGEGSTEAPIYALLYFSGADARDIAT